jgi:hypothetical protein
MVRALSWSDLVETVDTVEVGAVVVLHCRNPKEKLWGVLIGLDAVGATVRGLDVNSVEDWLRQETSGAEVLLTPSTVMVPMHRVDRIYLDESSGPVVSFGERYRTACGGDVREALLATSHQRDVQ